MRVENFNVDANQQKVTAMALFKSTVLDDRVTYVRPSFECIGEGESEECFRLVQQQIQAGMDMLLDMEVLIGDCSSMSTLITKLAEAAQQNNCFLAVAVPEEAARRSLADLSVNSPVPIYDSLRTAMIALGLDGDHPTT